MIAHVFHSIAKILPPLLAAQFGKTRTQADHPIFEKGIIMVNEALMAHSSH